MAHVGAAFRFATVDPNGVHWRLRRNCSVTPQQLWAVFGALGVVSLGIAGVFWSLGATLVVPFALLEMGALGVALLVYGRHAADAEHISVQPGRLVVETETAGQRQRVEFRPPWVQVLPLASRQALIEVSGQGRKVVVGRHVRADHRPEVAAEIRRALASGGMGHTL